MFHPLSDLHLGQRYSTLDIGISFDTIAVDENNNTITTLPNA